MKINNIVDELRIFITNILINDLPELKHNFLLEHTCSLDELYNLMCVGSVSGHDD